MEWQSEKSYCEERNWKWTSDFIDRCQKEMLELEKENRKLKEQIKAHRLYNACNY